MNNSVTFDKDMFRDAKRHSTGMVIAAALLLGLASVSLLASSLWPAGAALLVGQILFVAFVFAAVTLLVITAISQDIRRKRSKNGIRTT